MIFRIALPVLLLSLSAAYAAEKPVELKPATARETVENNCGLCHSVDYIRINASFLDRQGWTAEIAKMVTAYGAPIAQPDQAAIIDYLTANYGTGTGG